MVRSSIAVIPLLALLAPAVAHAEDKKPTPPPYGIAAIRAFMFLEESGTIDPRDMTDGKVTLWNTIIGEGDAKGPSSTTVIQVELAGPTFANTSGSLELVVTADGKKLLKQKVGVDTLFSEGAKLVVPFLVYNTGCDELAITATYTTPGKKKVKKTATVPFSCGE